MDMSQPITLLDGAIIHLDADTPATYAAVAVNALLNDDAKTGADKLARFSLAQRIHAQPEAVELKIDDAKTLKTALERTATTLVYGRFMELLGEVEKVTSNATI